MTSYIALSYWDLALASVLVLINAGLSIIFGLKIHRSLLVAAIRMAVQLTFVGLVLTALFSLVSPLWTGVTVLVMILVAGQEVMQRQDRRLSGWWVLWVGHRLYDDVFGSGDRLCPPDRNPAQPVV